MTPSEMQDGAFVMCGARLAIAGGWTQISNQVVFIERVLTEGPLSDEEGYGMVSDLAKVVVESACKRVLDERNITYGTGEDLPGLLKAVTDRVPIMPPESASETDARGSLKKTVGGLSTIIHGLCELRSIYGPASHGSADSKPGMPPLQALLVARAADALVGFLYQINCQDRATPSGSRFEYTDNVKLNSYIDDTNEEVRICGLVFSPSEVLYHVDINAYRETLADFESRNIDDGEETEPNKGEGQT